MSLIHWWPLNGDTKDRITNTQLTNNGATIASNGKIGSCYTFNGSTNLTIPYSTLNTLGSNPAKFSFAFWIKLNSTWAGWGQVFTLGRNGTSWTDIRIGFDIASDKTGYFTISNGSVAVSYNGPKHMLTTDKWYHVAATFDNKEMKLFIDGQPASTPQATASVLPSLSSDTIIAIGGNSNEKGECDINDVRVYDHALSQAEVKELSKALMIHYTFDDICAEPTTNIITGIKSAHGKASLESGRVKINWSPSGGDSYFMFNCSQTIKANSVYTLSFDCEGLKLGEVATFAVSNLSAASYNIALKNGRNSLTFTAGSDLMNDINTHNRLFFDDKTRTDGAVFYLTNFQLEEKDHATPYTPTTRESMLRNEAETIQPTIVSNIMLTNDSASGSYSLKCAGSTYLNHSPLGDASTGATASMWIKDMNTTGQIVAFADANSQLAFGPYGSYCCIGCVNGTNKRRALNVSSLWKTGEWNHVVVRKDSSNTFYCYINGVETTYGATDYWTHSTYLTIGARYSSGYSRQFTGLIDDFRLYYTCLTEDEVQDLYKARALITDKGDIETHQFVEDCSSLQVTNNHCVETHDIQEIGNEEYEQLEYIASTGTQYIDTGVYWTSEKATIVADLMVTTWKASSTIFGSEERYSGSSRYFAHILHAGSANGNYATYTGTGSIGTTTLTKDTRSVIEYITHGNNKVTTKVTVNGTTTTCVNNQTYSGTILTHQNSTQTAANRGHIYIFSNHNSYNSTDGIQKMAAMRLYRFTMIQDDIYLRDFIPCRRKSDSKVGLFDLVTGQFYTSPVGNFTAGNVVTDEDITAKFLSGGSIQARQFIEI